MPKRSGFSHAFAALAVMITGPYLREYIQLFVSIKDIVRVVERIAFLLSIQTNLKVQILTMVISAGVIVILAFVWGYLFHIKVILE